MQAFVCGSGVYVYPDVYRTLMVQLRSKMAKDSKPPASWLAVELFSMFVNKDEYKPPANEPVDPQIKDAIISEYHIKDLAQCAWYFDIVIHDTLKGSL